MDSSVDKDAKGKKMIRIDPSKLDSSVQNSLKNALAKLKGPKKGGKAKKVVAVPKPQSNVAVAVTRHQNSKPSQVQGISPSNITTTVAAAAAVPVANHYQHIANTSAAAATAIVTPQPNTIDIRSTQMSMGRIQDGQFTTTTHHKILDPVKNLIRDRLEVKRAKLAWNSLSNNINSMLEAAKSNSVGDEHKDKQPSTAIAGPPQETNQNLIPDFKSTFKAPRTVVAQPNNDTIAIESPPVYKMQVQVQPVMVPVPPEMDIELLAFPIVISTNPNEPLDPHPNQSIIDIASLPVILMPSEPQAEVKIEPIAVVTNEDDDNFESPEMELEESSVSHIVSDVSPVTSNRISVIENIEAKHIDFLNMVVSQPNVSIITPDRPIKSTAAAVVDGNEAANNTKCQSGDEEEEDFVGFETNAEDMPGLRKKYDQFIDKFDKKQSPVKANAVKEERNDMEDEKTKNALLDEKSEKAMDINSNLTMENPETKLVPEICSGGEKAKKILIETQIGEQPVENPETVNTNIVDDFAVAESSEVNPTQQAAVPGSLASSQKQIKSTKSRTKSPAKSPEKTKLESKKPFPEAPMRKIKFKPNISGRAAAKKVEVSKRIRPSIVSPIVVTPKNNESSRESEKTKDESLDNNSPISEVGMEISAPNLSEEVPKLPEFEKLNAIAKNSTSEIDQISEATSAKIISMVITAQESPTNELNPDEELYSTTPNLPEPKTSPPILPSTDNEKSKTLEIIETIKPVLSESEAVPVEVPVLPLSQSESPVLLSDRELKSKSVEEPASVKASPTKTCDTLEIAKTTEKAPVIANQIRSEETSSNAVADKSESDATPGHSKQSSGKRNSMMQLLRNSPSFKKLCEEINSENPSAEESASDTEDDGEDVEEEESITIPKKLFERFLRRDNLILDMIMSKRGKKKQKKDDAKLDVHRDAEVPQKDSVESADEKELTMDSEAETQATLLSTPMVGSPAKEDSLSGTEDRECSPSLDNDVGESDPDEELKEAEMGDKSGALEIVEDWNDESAKMEVNQTEDCVPERETEGSGIIVNQKEDNVAEPETEVREINIVLEKADQEELVDDKVEDNSLAIVVPATQFVIADTSDVLDPKTCEEPLVETTDPISPNKDLAGILEEKEHQEKQTEDILPVNSDTIPTISTVIEMPTKKTTRRSLVQQKVQPVLASVRRTRKAADIQPQAMSDVSEINEVLEKPDQDESVNENVEDNSSAIVVPATEVVVADTSELVGPEPLVETIDPASTKKDVAVILEEKEHQEKQTENILLVNSDIIPTSSTLIRMPTKKATRRSLVQQEVQPVMANVRRTRKVADIQPQAMSDVSEINKVLEKAEQDESVNENVEDNSSAIVVPATEFVIGDTSEVVDPESCKEPLVETADPPSTNKDLLDLLKEKEAQENQIKNVLPLNSEIIPASSTAIEMPTKKTSRRSILQQDVHPVMTNVRRTRKATDIQPQALSDVSEINKVHKKADQDELVNEKLEDNSSVNVVPVFVEGDTIEVVDPKTCEEPLVETADPASTNKDLTDLLNLLMEKELQEKQTENVLPVVSDIIPASSKVIEMPTKKATRRSLLQQEVHPVMANVRRTRNATDIQPLAISDAKTDNKKPPPIANDFAQNKPKPLVSLEQTPRRNKKAEVVPEANQQVVCKLEVDTSNISSLNNPPVDVTPIKLLTPQPIEDLSLRSEKTRELKREPKGAGKIPKTLQDNRIKPAPLMSPTLAITSTNVIAPPTSARSTRRALKRGIETIDNKSHNELESKQVVNLVLTPVTVDIDTYKPITPVPVHSRTSRRKLESESDNGIVKDSLSKDVVIKDENKKMKTMDKSSVSYIVTTPKLVVGQERQPQNTKKIFVETLQNPNEVEILPAPDREPEPINDIMQVDPSVPTSVSPATPQTLIGRSSRKTKKREVDESFLVEILPAPPSNDEEDAIDVIKPSTTLSEGRKSGRVRKSSWKVQWNIVESPVKSEGIPTLTLKRPSTRRVSITRSEIAVPAPSIPVKVAGAANASMSAKGSLKRRFSVVPLKAPEVVVALKTLEAKEDRQRNLSNGNKSEDMPTLQLNTKASSTEVDLDAEELKEKLTMTLKRPTRKSNTSKERSMEPEEPTKKKGRLNSSAVDLEPVAEPSQPPSRESSRSRRSTEKSLAKPSEPSESLPSTSTLTSPPPPSKSQAKISAFFTPTTSKSSSSKGVKHNICGNCKAEVPLRQWQSHVNTHIGVAWREGVDKAIDLKNDPEMVRTISAFMVKRRSKTIKCPKCDEVRKSAVGMVSHLHNCGLTADEQTELMVECQYCEKRLMAISMSTHYSRTCPVLFEQRQQKLALENGTVYSAPSYEFTARGRRVKQPKPIVQAFDVQMHYHRKLFTSRVHGKWVRESQLGILIRCYSGKCQFTTKDLREIELHHNSCEEAQLNKYTCKVCREESRTRPEMEEHVMKVHFAHKKDKRREREKEPGEVDAAEESEALVGSESSESEGMASDADENEDFNASDDSEEDKDYNMDEEVGGNREPKCRWKMPPGPFDPYWKEKAMKRFSSYARKYDQFKSGNYSKEPLFPDWTVPDDSQIEIVDTVPLLDKEHDQQQQAQECSNTFVHIKCGCLVESMAWVPLPDTCEPVLALVCKPKDLPYMKMSHTAKMDTLVQFWNVGMDEGEFSASLMFSIVRPDGPVIALKFCPSGGYSEDRLALVALTSVTGDVNIVAVPQFRAEYEGKALKVPVKCVLKSNVASVGTTVDWDRRKGHSVVMAGFFNGMVAMWKLSKDGQNEKAGNSLLRDMEGHLMPFKIIAPFTVPINSLEMNGSYFFACGGPQLKVYDMSTMACHESLMHSNSVLDISSAQWIPNTPFLVVGMSRSSHSIGLQLVLPFGLAIEPFRLVSETSSITATNFSVSQCRLLVGTANGDVWLRDLSTYSGWYQGDKYRKVITSMDDGKVIEGKMKTKTRPEAVKCMDWNGAESYKRWYAVAYEQGLVRVSKTR